MFGFLHYYFDGCGSVKCFYGVLDFLVLCCWFTFGVRWEGGNNLRLGVAVVQVGESRFFGVVFYRLWV